jgi:hypothetical protein
VRRIATLMKRLWFVMATAKNQVVDRTTLIWICRKDVKWTDLSHDMVPW